VQAQPAHRVQLQFPVVNYSVESQVCVCRRRYLSMCVYYCMTSVRPECVFIVCVYYCSTYYKAVREGWGGNGGHVYVLRFFST